MSGPRTGARLLVVACGSSKADQPMPAAELYTGSLFRAAARAAAADGRPWLILSAEHGLVTPGTVLAPYDRTLGGPGDADRLDALLRRQLPAAAAGPLGGVEAWTPARYTAALARAGARVVLAPLAGLGIGAQIGWLTRHALSCEANLAATGQRPGPAAAANWLVRDTGLLYAGSISAHRGQPVVAMHVTGTDDDGTLLGADRYEAVLANGVHLRDVRAASLIPAPATPAATCPGTAARPARTPAAAAPRPPAAARGRAISTR